MGNGGIPIAPESNNPSPAQAQHLITLYAEGELQQALVVANQLLLNSPSSSFLYNILGAAQVGLGQFDEAVASYKRAIEIEPSDAKTHFNLGIAQAEREDFAAAINSYKQALGIDPDYVVAYVNLGNAFKDAGNLTQAMKSYRHALKIDPEFAEVYCNMGNALKDFGELDKAISTYRMALQIQPDYAEAYNNMGGAFNHKGELEQAIVCYTRALSINPEYIDASWNMVGTAASSDDARNWLERCLEIDPDFFNARLLLCALDYFRGDRKSFDDLTQSEFRDHPTLRSITWVTGLPVLPELLFNKWLFFDFVTARSLSDRPFYEFGVFRGDAFRYLMRTFRKGFGFDTFEGLPEDWHDERAGSYSSEGDVPEIEGGEFIVGKFEDTLADFFSETRPVASVVNFDADLYSSTICALNGAKSVIDSSTILIFDEFLMNDQWEQDEFRALDEFCTANGYNFEVLAVSFFTKQVAIKLTGI